MKVIKYCSEFQSEWNTFLENARNATFLFDRNFMEYHSTRFHDHSLIIKDDNGKMLALMPANITDENILISHQGLTYGGLVVRKGKKLLHTIDYFSKLLKYLNDNEIETLVYKEIPAFYNDIPFDEQQYVFFLLKAELIRRDTVSVIKNGSRPPYQRRRIRSINRAKKIGVEIRNDNNFDDFWNLVLMPNLQKRHGVNPAHSLDEIKHLHSLFPDNIKQFNAYWKGEIMAGATIFEMQSVAHAQYSSGSDEGKKNGSLDLLFDTLISRIYAQKNYFDFGNSNELDGLKINKGLIDWKEGFGARTCSQNFYRIKTSNYVLLKQVINSDQEVSSDYSSMEW